jgi:4-amino-4-deoxy-L-arabinose transferase-like glycosyltransferase
MSRLRWSFAVLALALVVAPLAASAPLFDPDEGLHAAIAQEMVLRGDYVTPTFLGEPFLDKPSLFFWAEAASMRVLGMNEAAVRVPPLLFGLLGMLSVAWLGRTLFGESAGLTAGIVYATMLLPLGVSQVAVHDIGLIPFMCVAATMLVLSIDRDDRSPWLPGIAAGVALGLSILTKGLVGVVFTVILAACLAVYRRSALRRLAIVLVIAAVVALTIAAPWYLAMEHAHPGYLHYYFVERHLQGYLTASQRHAGRPWWYYVPLLLGGALPWTIYLPGAARMARGHPLRLIVWSWFMLGFVFLSVGESKLVTYALPLFPALAIIIGEFVDRNTSGFTLLVHAMVLALLPPLGLLALQWSLGARHPSLWLSIVVCSLLTIYAGWRAKQSVFQYVSVSWIVAMSVIALISLMTVAPRFAAWQTGKDLARTLNSGGRLPSRVSVLDERIGSVVFYLAPALRAEATKERINEVSLAEAVGRMRVDPPDALLAVRNNRLARFNRLFATPPPADARAGTFTVFRTQTLRLALQQR